MWKNIETVKYHVKSKNIIPDQMRRSSAMGI